MLLRRLGRGGCQARRAATRVRVARTTLLEDSLVSVDCSVLEMGACGGPGPAEEETDEFGSRGREGPANNPLACSWHAMLDQRRPLTLFAPNASHTARHPSREAPSLLVCLVRAIFVCRRILERLDEHPVLFGAQHVHADCDGSDGGAWIVRLACSPSRVMFRSLTFFVYLALALRRTRVA